MSIGSWDPQQNQQHFTIDSVVLKQFIALSQQQQLDRLAQRLSAEQQQQQAPLMQQSKASWHTAARALSNDELIALIRFFTVAESLPGWQAGNQSPVIWLNQVLKQRGVKLDRTLLQWIKAHSDNRFLPHGQL